MAGMDYLLQMGAAVLAILVAAFFFVGTPLNHWVFYGPVAAGAAYGVAVWRARRRFRSEGH